MNAWEIFRNIFVCATLGGLAVFDTLCGTFAGGAVVHLCPSSTICYRVSSLSDRCEFREGSGPPSRRFETSLTGDEKTGNNNTTRNQRNYNKLKPFGYFDFGVVSFTFSAYCCCAEVSRLAERHASADLVMGGGDGDGGAVTAMLSLQETESHPHGTTSATQ